MSGRIIRPGTSAIRRGGEGIYLPGISRLGDADASLGRVASTPVILPTATITEVGVKGLSSGYVDIGNMSLPAGDWCISFTGAPPTAANLDYFLLSLGTQSDTILASNGNLVIGFPGLGASPASSYGWAAVGIDDAANGLSQRQFTAFTAAAQYGVSGPSQSAGANDGAVRTCFIQKSGSTVSFWQIDLNGCAIKYSEALTSFGAVAAKPAFLGCLGKLALTGFSTMKYQRFFRIAQALTPYHMEAIASGVDPRVVPGVTFSSGAGDLLFIFNVNPADLQTYTDLIQSQVATAHGTFSAQANLLPATVDQNQIRFNVMRYQTYQSQGATTDIFLEDMSVYGVDGDIQVSVLNNGGGFPGTVQVPYATIGRSRNGKASGVITCATSANPVFLKTRKLVNGVVTGAADYFLTYNRIDTGIVIDFIGESLPEQMRTTGSQPVTSGPVGFNTRTQSSLYDPYTGAHFGPGCSALTAPGYGEGNLIKILAAALSTQQIMTMNDAVSGTLLSDWLADNHINTMSPLGMWSNFLVNARRFRPSIIGFGQGINSFGVSRAVYYSQLDQLKAKFLAANFTWPWKVAINPVVNRFDATANYDVYAHDIRAATIQWIDDQVAAGETRFILGYTTADTLRADVDGGGIHRNATVGGYGLDSERLGQTILFLLGNQTYSGVGPRIASIERISSTVKRVHFNQNGGTSLRTKGGGAPSGFYASLSSAMFTTGPTFTSPLAISGTALSLANTAVDITHADDGGVNPYIWYQPGLPGLGITDAAEHIDNALSDDRSPALNTARGYPVVPLASPIQSA